MDLPPSDVGRPRRRYAVPGTFLRPYRADPVPRSGTKVPGTGNAASYRDPCDPGGVVVWWRAERRRVPCSYMRPSLGLGPMDWTTHKVPFYSLRGQNRPFLFLFRFAREGTEQNIPGVKVKVKSTKEWLSGLRSQKIMVNRVLATRTVSYLEEKKEEDR